MPPCVIVPAYNAAETIGPLVERIRRLGLDVLVIDDGSTDQTARAAIGRGARVISQLQNVGKGTALRAGFAAALQAGYDAVVTMDSDGQHDPEDIPKLLESLQRPEVGMALGHRLSAPTLMPPLRRWTNRFMSLIVSACAGQRIPDSQCGFRVIRRKVLETTRLSASRFDLETELVLAAARAGWAIASVPIRPIYTDRHISYIRPLRDGARFVWMIARFLGRQ